MYGWDDTVRGVYLKIQLLKLIFPDCSLFGGDSVTHFVKTVRKKQRIVHVPLDVIIMFSSSAGAVHGFLVDNDIIIALILVYNTCVDKC